MDTFFAGLDGSHFAATSSEYSGITTVDDGDLAARRSTTSAAPRRAINTSTAVAEACAIANDAPDANAVYFLFTSTGAGHVNYCAWHSWGTCSNGAPIQVAYMPNIDSIAGCDPQDAWTGHSQGRSRAGQRDLARVVRGEHRSARRRLVRLERRRERRQVRLVVQRAGHARRTAAVEAAGGVVECGYDTSSGFANTSGQLGCLQGN